MWWGMQVLLGTEEVVGVHCYSTQTFEHYLHFLMLKNVGV